MAKKKDNAENKEKKKREGHRLFVVSKEAKRRLIPPFIMLTAGAVSSILMVMQGRYELHEFLKTGTSKAPTQTQDLTNSFEEFEVLLHDTWYYYNMWIENIKCKLTP